MRRERGANAICRKKRICDDAALGEEKRKIIWEMESGRDNAKTYHEKKSEGGSVERRKKFRRAFFMFITYMPEEN